MPIGFGYLLEMPVTSTFVSNRGSVVAFAAIIPFFATGIIGAYHSCCLGRYWHFLLIIIGLCRVNLPDSVVLSGSLLIFISSYVS